MSYSVNTMITICAEHVATYYLPHWNNLDDDSLCEALTKFGDDLDERIQSVFDTRFPSLELVCGIDMDSCQERLVNLDYNEFVQENPQASVSYIMISEAVFDTVRRFAIEQASKCDEWNR